MIEITENQFIINNEVEVDSLSYEHTATEGNNSIVCKIIIKNVEQESEFLKNNIAFGINFEDGNDLLSEGEYSPDNIYDLSELVKKVGQNYELEVKLAVESKFDTLNSFVKIYKRDSENEYNKVYKEKVIENKDIKVVNFFDYSYLVLNAFDIEEKTPYQLQQEFNEKNANRINNYSYVSDLFFHFNSNNRLACFFGVDAKSFIYDNNSIEVINNNQFFTSYVNSRSLVEEINGYFYNEDGNTYIAPTVFEAGLSSVLGETFAVSKEISKSYDKTKMMGYDVNVSFVDAPVAFLNDVMLPKLRDEINFLNEIQIMDGEPNQIVTSQIEGLISIYKNYLEQGSQNFEEAFRFYDSNTTISINETIRLALIDIGQKSYNTLLNSLESKYLLDDTNDFITKDFGRIIDLSRIDFGVNILEEKGELVDVFNRDELTARGEQEALKYDLVNSTYFGYLTSLNLVVDGNEVLDNRSSALSDFTYNQSLTYLNSFNDIINKNIDKDAVIYTDKRIDGLTNQEVLTEDRTEQNNFSINSLSVAQNLNFRSIRTSNDALTIRNNIVKTFQIPTTLATNLCDGPEDLSSPQNEGLRKKNINKENFIGNSLITYALLNRVKALHNNYFYEPYYAIDEATETDNLPIQAQFLASFYSTDTGEEEPAYLRKSNLLNEITNFGIIYHNFKAIFCVKIYSKEDNDFVALDYDRLLTLTPGSNYLCTIDTYKNASYGMDVPELLRTSIYNRYFILAV